MGQTVSRWCSSGYEAVGGSSYHTSPGNPCPHSGAEANGTAEQREKTRNGTSQQSRQRNAKERLLGVWHAVGEWRYYAVWADGSTTHFGRAGAGATWIDGCSREERRRVREAYAKSKLVHQWNSQVGLESALLWGPTRSLVRNIELFHERYGC